MKRTQSSTGNSGHPIAVAAERTGLTQDVIRVWERRYGAVKPARTKGGQRLYTNADVERLTLLNVATDAGRSIGQIARLSTRELRLMVDEDRSAREGRSVSVPDRLDTAEFVALGLALTRSLAGTELNLHLRRAAASLGVTAFVARVAVPLLRQVGEEWHAGRLTPSQEHLASSVLHDILVGTMRGFSQRNGASRVLVATPAGERHAIGAAVVGAAAAMEGWNVVYLGADLPATEIAAAAKAADVAIVALSIVYVDDRQRLLTEVRSLRKQMPQHMSLVVGGSGAALIERDLSAAGVRVARDIDGVFASQS